ncbi:MAG: RIP metalloprotease RseP [Geitlerinemataceae cyanobacterium]
MSVLAAIGVLALLIAVHELGHFLAARLQGIHVNRFSLGFGPVLLEYQGEKTQYAVRAFPLGGFVGFPDDDPDSTIPDDDPDLLRNRPVFDRAIVISAGVIANLIFAYVVLVAQVGATGVPDGFDYQPGVAVPQVISPDSPAGKAGLKSGDTILSVDGDVLPANQDAIVELKNAIERSADREVLFEVLRGSEVLELNATPEATGDGLGRIGVQLAPNGEAIFRQPSNPIEIFTLGAQRFQSIFVGTAGGFYQLVTNFGETAGQLASPVKIVQQGAVVAEDNATNLLVFAAVISINLAIVNILPLPALDGGQLAFLIVEWLRGKPVPTHIQDGVMQSGLLLLFGLGIFLIVRDTTQLDWFQQLTR